MITNGILLVFQAVINIILLPLTALNIVIDFIGSIPAVVTFLQVVAYVLPWSNILPIIFIIIGIFTFRIAIALIKFVKGFIPTLGG